MTHLHRNCRADQGKLARASLAEIETEIADILDLTENVQRTVEACGAVWQLAEAVKGLAWAVGSLASHYEDAAVGAATDGGGAA